MHKYNVTFPSYLYSRLYFVFFQSFFIFVFLFLFQFCFLHSLCLCFMLYNFDSLSFFVIFFFLGSVHSYNSSVRLFLSVTVRVGLFLFGSIRLLLSIFFTINFFCHIPLFIWHLETRNDYLLLFYRKFWFCPQTNIIKKRIFLSFWFLFTVLFFNVFFFVLGSLCHTATNQMENKIVFRMN